MDTPSPVATQPSRKNRLCRSWLQGLSELLQTVLLAGLLFMAVNFLTARIRVDGSSMEPTLHNGEFVVVNRLAYRWSDLTRGDIVVFRFPRTLKGASSSALSDCPGITSASRMASWWSTTCAPRALYRCPASLLRQLAGGARRGASSWRIATTLRTPRTGECFPSKTSSGVRFWFIGRSRMLGVIPHATSGVAAEERTQAMAGSYSRESMVKGAIPF